MDYTLKCVNRSDLIFNTGLGSYLYTKDGDRYLDFIQGVATNVFGHCDKEIQNIIKDQSEKFFHISNYFRSEELEYASEKLSKLSINGKVFFVNSGAEAVETAIKTTRRYFYLKGNSQKYEIICLHNSFHGRTTGAISAQGNEKYLEGFEPRLPGFKHANLNDIDSVKKLITKNTAGIMLELIQGEGGLEICNKDFVLNIKEICKENDILLIFDEIQTGIGRTGRMFCFEHFEIQPDILTTAKGLGAGIPVGACVISSKIADCMTVGTHGSTFGGNPFATRVAGYVLNIVSNEKFLENVNKSGEKIKNIISEVKHQFPDIIDSERGLGLLLGIKLKEGYTPKDLMLSARKNKLLLAPCSANNTIRILPPLNIDSKVIEDFKEKLINSIFNMIDLQS